MWFQNRRAKWRKRENTKKGPGRPAHNAHPQTCSGEPIPAEELERREKERLEKKRRKQEQRIRRLEAKNSCCISASTRDSSLDSYYSVSGEVRKSSEDETVDVIGDGTASNNQSPTGVGRNQEIDDDGDDDNDDRRAKTGDRSQHRRSLRRARDYGVECDDAAFQVIGGPSVDSGSGGDDADSTRMPPSHHRPCLSSFCAQPEVSGVRSPWSAGRSVGGIQQRSSTSVDSSSCLKERSGSKDDARIGVEDGNKTCRLMLDSNPKVSTKCAKDSSYNRCNSFSIWRILEEQPSSTSGGWQSSAGKEFPSGGAVFVGLERPASFDQPIGFQVERVSSPM